MPRSHPLTSRSDYGSIEEWMAAVQAIKAMNAMKEMKAMKSGAMTSAGAYRSVAKTMGLKPKHVKAAVEGFLGLAAAQLSIESEIAGMLNLKLKVKPASKTVKVFPTKKLKAMVL